MAYKTRAAKPIEERLFPRIDASGDCWIWTGAIHKRNGYGVINKGRRLGAARVHRVVWELLVGPVEPGLDLDHLCRVRACCNPDHLQPATRLTNVTRGSHGAGRPRGFRCDHPNTPANTITTKRGTVTCRACMNASNVRYRLRKKASA
jgi:hypothetical protein